MNCKITMTVNPVQHVRCQCDVSFDEAYHSLTSTLPRVEARLFEILQQADSENIKRERELGPKLWIFKESDHGSLLAAEGRRTKATQFDIGNPLTAERMMAYQIQAALYAPLRVLLYETEDGTAMFEYDLPSSMFGQCGVSAVTEVGMELDEALEAALTKAGRRQ